MKEIRFSQHSQLKLYLLSNRGMLVSQDFIIETIRSPDKLESKEDNKRIAQKKLNESLVIGLSKVLFESFIMNLTHLF